MPDVASTLNNLANLQDDLGRYDDAEKNYQEALRIRRKFAESNPNAYMPDVALTLWNLSCLKSGQEKFKEERETWIEALEVYEWLEQNGKRSYVEEIRQIKRFIRELK